MVIMGWIPSRRKFWILKILRRKFWILEIHSNERLSTQEIF
jgi:hypothetical protein